MTPSRRGRLTVGAVGFVLLTSGVSRILEPRVGFWTCVRAEMGQRRDLDAHADPVVGRTRPDLRAQPRGSEHRTSVTVVLLSCVSTLVALLAVTLYSVLAGVTRDVWPVFPLVIWSFLTAGGAVAVVAVWPDPIRAGLAAVSRARWRLRGRRGALEDRWPPDDARRGPAVDRLGPYVARAVNLAHACRQDVRRFLGRGKAAGACLCLAERAVSDRPRSW